MLIKLFSDFGLMIAQQTRIHIDCFMAGGWHTCYPVSEMQTVGEGPGETPSALRCLSSLGNSFIADVKRPAKDFWGALCSLLVSVSEAFSLLYFQFSWVAQSCPTLCDPVNRSTPGLPVHHQLPELTQTHVHWVCDAIQPSHPLSSPSPPTFNLSQHQGLFIWVSSLHQVAKVLEFQLQHQSFQWFHSRLISLRSFKTDFP